MQYILLIYLLIAFGIFIVPGCFKKYVGIMLASVVLSFSVRWRHAGFGALGQFDTAFYFLGTHQLLILSAYQLLS